MIDIFSAALGFFSGGIIGFITTTLFSVGKIDRLSFFVSSLRVQLENAEEELHIAQKERLNLAAKLAINKPKRDTRGRFIPKSKGKK